MHGRVRSGAVLSLLAVSVVTCTELPTGTSRSAHLLVVPQLTQAASAAALQLAAFSLAIDNVRIVVVRPSIPPDTLIDTTLVVAPDADSVVADLDLPKARIGEQLSAGIELRDGTEILFAGVQQVTARARGSKESDGVPTVFVGPGASAVSLRIAPRDTTIRGADTVVFRHVARDAASQVVPDAEVSWTSSDATIASIDDAGVLRASGLHGTVQITGRTLGGLRDSTNATLVGQASQLAVTTAPPNSVADRSTFDTQPVVQLEDAAGTGTPIAGVTVHAALAPAGAPPVGATGAATLHGTVNVVTGADGAAAFTNLSAVGLTGSYVLTFTAPGVTSASVPLTVTPGAATTMSVASGDAQTVQVGTPVPNPPTVLVADVDGNGVSGVAVTFAVSGGGGSVTGASASTDATGLAAVGSWTLGATPGPNSLTATASGLSGSPLTFSATATLGAPTDIAVAAGDNQTATVATAVAVPPQVKVTDAQGNPVAGVAVTFAVATGGGSITGASQATDANGLAAVGSWTLGNTAGANTLTATSNGLNGSPVTFTATGTVGAAASIAISAGNGQTATVATAVATKPAVVVTDAHGNPVSGVAVTFAVASGGGSRTGGSQTTDASGIATVGSWTLGPTAGANTLTATSTGLTGSPLTFTATGKAGSAASISVKAGDNQSAVAGTAVAIKPSVKVSDAHGNGVSGVTVNFSVTGGGGSITGASQTTNASGVATVGSWTLGATPGPNSLKAASAGLSGSPLTFSATGTTTGTQVTFSECPDYSILWFAYQNDGGSWTTVPVTNNSVSFVATDKLAVAYIEQYQSGSSVNSYIAFLTAGELNAASAYVCGSTGTKSLNGSVAGLGSLQSASVKLGDAGAFPTFGTPTFSLTNVGSGALDLLASRYNTITSLDYIQQPDAFIARRGVTYANGSTIPVLDFSGSVITPVANTVTATGVIAGESPSFSGTLYTGATTYLETFYANMGSGTPSTTMYSFPASALVAGDLQEVDVWDYNSTTGSARGVYKYFLTPADQTLALGPDLNVPTVTEVASAPYPMFRFQLSSQPEYGGSALLSLYQSTTSRSEEIIVTSGYFSGTPATWDVTVPDLSGLSGFDPSWMLTAGESTDWFPYAYSDNYYKDVYSDGGGYTWATGAGSTLTALRPLSSALPPLRSGPPRKMAARRRELLRAAERAQGGSR